MRISKSFMKIPGIVFLFSAFLFFGGCSDKPVKNVDAKGSSIVCFGDSLTMGYGVERGQDYPANLAKLVNIPVINAGIDGDTTVEAINRIGSDVLSKNPLLVIIEFGGNDFLRKIPLEETVSNIEEMIRKFQGSGIMVAIADVGTGMIMSEYSKAYKKISKEYQVIFIPKMMSGIFTNPSLKSDFIHPNAQGYTMIAHRVYRAILSYLNQNTVMQSLSANIKG